MRLMMDLWFALLLISNLLAPRRAAQRELWSWRKREAHKRFVLVFETVLFPRGIVSNWGTKMVDAEILNTHEHCRQRIPANYNGVNGIGSLYHILYHIPYPTFLWYFHHRS